MYYSRDIGVACYDYDARSASRPNIIKIADFNGGQRLWTFPIMFVCNFTCVSFVHYGLVFV